MGAEEKLERDIIVNSFYVIEKFKKEKKSVTNLKLQKLMYFMEALYMATSDENSLFEQEFLAWNFGPVCRELYDYYKDYGNDEIQLSESEKKRAKKIPRINLILVDALFKMFSSWSTYDLVELTHLKGSPWFLVYDEEEKNIIISKEETKNWFKEKLKINDKER